MSAISVDPEWSGPLLYCPKCSDGHALVFACECGTPKVSRAEVVRIVRDGAPPRGHERE